MTSPPQQRHPEPQRSRDPRQESRIRDWSVALFIMAAIAFTPPLVMVFDRPVLVLGMPLLFIYMFAVWGALIFMIGRIAVRDRRPPPGEGG